MSREIITQHSQRQLARSWHFCLTLSMLGKYFSRQHLVFLFFSKKNRRRNIMQIVSYNETICIKCQSLFSGRSKKNIVNLPSAELAQRHAVFQASPTFGVRSEGAVSCPQIITALRMAIYMYKLIHDVQTKLSHNVRKCTVQAGT